MLSSNLKLVSVNSNELEGEVPEKLDRSNRVTRVSVVCLHCRFVLRVIIAVLPCILRYRCSSCDYTSNLLLLQDDREQLDMTLFLIKIHQQSQSIYIFWQKK